MIVGVARLKMRIHGNHSLKGKRRVVKSVISQIRNRFNVAASEVDDHDLWQQAEIGIAAVGNEHAVVNSALDKILDFVERVSEAEIVNSSLDIINLGRE